MMFFKNHFTHYKPPNMDHFLIYIIVSSLVTLISIMFAYKPEDEELRLLDFGSADMDGNSIDKAPVYSEQPMKTDTAF